MQLLRSVSTLRSLYERFSTSNCVMSPIEEGSSCKELCDKLSDLAFVSKGNGKGLRGRFVSSGSMKRNCTHLQIRQTSPY